jgi:hypothetical protein
MRMISQIVIGLTGVTAIWLSQAQDEGSRRWACVVALIGQPFWFYAMWSAEQWGILVLCCFYTISWMRGFYYHWIKHV